MREERFDEGNPRGSMQDGRLDGADPIGPILGEPIRNGRSEELIQEADARETI